MFSKKWINGNKLENVKIEFIAIYPFFCKQTKTVYIVGFLKFYSFPIEFMAQRTGEKNLVAAKKYCHFCTKTVQTLHNKKVPNETFVFMQNKRSFPAKMAMFLASTSFFHEFFGP